MKIIFAEEPNRKPETIPEITGTRAPRTGECIQLSDGKRYRILSVIYAPNVKGREYAYDIHLEVVRI